MKNSSADYSNHKLSINDPAKFIFFINAFHFQIIKLQYFSIVWPVFIAFVLKR